MKVRIALLCDEESVQIEVEPLTTLTISLEGGPSLQELQRYTQRYGVRWLEQSEGCHVLLLPWGTFQRRMEGSCREREELLYLVHLPGGGILEHRRVPACPSGLGSSPSVGRLSLFHPV